ncbi:hypothetical protein V6N11_054204 [Hibiscus sabdariffa]|uniref:MATH domain-containing protein n=1 Tax=Hibiscus sabdariffa TaxID=183260 RepID=A0ABR2S3D4_9ROSI
MEVNGKFRCMDINEKLRKFTWRIENFSTIKDQMFCSQDFIVDGNKWRIHIYPKGINVDYLSIFLCVANSATLPSGWTAYAQFGFAVMDQIDRRASVTQAVATREFSANGGNWLFGFPRFLLLNELHDPERGYLVNDACLVEAYFSTDKTKALISHELIVETDSDKLKTAETTCDKAVIDNQKTAVIKPEELTTPPPTQPSCRTVAIEPEEPTEEDIKTFFTSLESERSSSDTVFSKEEAKEALAKVDEALNTTPLNFYDSGKYFSLQQAFKILASFDCSSTTLTTKQKNELLAMEESLKELADRTAKAVRDKSRLTEKESIKLTITRNLDHNLVRYKEVESEVKWVEQKHAALLAERRGIFRSSKKMKMELEALGKEWTEYEANAKAAEAEWRRMKDFISSIKGRI